MDERFRPRKHAKENIIKMDATSSKVKAIKLRTTGGKVKGKDKVPKTEYLYVIYDGEGVYSTQPTTLERKGEQKDIKVVSSMSEDEREKYGPRRYIICLGSRYLKLLLILYLYIRLWSQHQLHKAFLPSISID